jgi:hypothetical protein
MKRLSLRPYRRWKQQFIRLRAAQRTPTHWGLDPHCPLSALLPRIEPEDSALVVGSGAAATTYLLAAHDVAVTFLADELGSVERVESRMAAEALSSLFESYVTQFDPALPEFLSFLDGFDMVVLDPSVLQELNSADRYELISDLQRRSRPGGVHVILPCCPAIAPDALRSLYPDWAQEEMKRRRRGPYAKCAPGLILSKPLCPGDTA